MNCLALGLILLYYYIFMQYCRGLFPGPKHSQIYILLSLAIVLASYWLLDMQDLSGFRFPAVMVVMIVGLRLSSGMNWLQALCSGSFCVLSAYCFRGVFISIGTLVFQGHDPSSDTNAYYAITVFVLPLALLFLLGLRRTIFPDGKIKKLLNNRSQLKLIVAYDIIAAINLTNLNFGRDLSPYDIRHLGLYLSPYGVWGMRVSIGNFLLTFVMLLYAIYQSIQSTELLEYRCRTQLLEEQYEQQLRHYKSYQKHTESFRAFKHDYQSMMVPLKALLKAQDSEKAIQLIDDLYEDMQKRVAIHKRHSDNVILDAMLQDMANVCEEKEIRFQFSVFAPRNTELSKLDAIRIFSNITKNAVEACEKLPVSERFIHMATGNDDQWVTLEVVNSYDGNIRMNKGTLMTTKSEKEGHGLGLGIVQEIAQDLGGFVIYDADAAKRTFWIRIHIPRLRQTQQADQEAEN